MCNGNRQVNQQNIVEVIMDLICFAKKHWDDDNMIKAKQHLENALSCVEKWQKK
jgi:hypothetical protein